jgi:4-hydroxybenzoate polyprenyltransferase
MREALIVLEVVLFVGIGYFARKWEVGLARGVLPPGGTLPVILRALRPHAWVVLATVFVLLASAGLHRDLVYVLPAVFFQQAFLFAVNDYCDRELDGLNPFKKRRNVLSSGELGLREGRLLLVLVFLLGLLLPLRLGWQPTLLSAVFLAASYAYSAPPFRLKGRVLWDLVSHAFLVFSYPFLFTSVALGLCGPRNLTLYAIFVLVSLYIQIGQETRDLEEDKQVETNSIITLGYRKAFLCMTALLGSALALSFGLVLSRQVSPLYLLISAQCAFHLRDVYLTWRSGNYPMCFQNAWGGFIKKTLVGSVPVLLWWGLMG